MTIKEIAKLAGVSISTVSKIINNKDQNITSSTRNRVLQIVKEYNYTPYSTVKSISRAKTFVIAILLKDLEKCSQFINGVLDTAQSHGYNVMLFDSQNDHCTELKHITSICKNNIDAVIWAPVSAESLNHEHYLEEQNIAVACVNAPEGCPSYRIDFRKMGYALTQKLLDYKHNKIGFLLDPQSHRSLMTLEGFRQCLFDNGIPFDEKMLLLTSDENYMPKILNYQFTGLVSSHFASSLLLYAEAERFHYHIPYDLSLVTLKDDAQGPLSFPSISSMNIPHREFGAYVCQKLITVCEKNGSPSENLWFSGESQLDREDSISIPPSLRNKKIVVVGSINIDMTFNVDWLPQAGKTTRILNATTTLGGKGANQAMGAAKLGCEVTLIGELGSDMDSAFILDLLNQERISTQGIHRSSHFQTGKAYIYIERDGESSITILEGANSDVSPEHIQHCEHLFKNAGFCLLSTELPLPTILAAAKLGRRIGARNVVKPAAQKSIPDQLLALTDIFIPNRKEAAALCPHYSSIEDQARYFFSKGIQTVIITLGNEGCYLKDAETARYYPASDFTVIDTTGGADAFIAALTSYLTEGYSMDQSIRIAAYAAGFCISRQGVVPSLVDRRTLETHIGKLEPELLSKIK